MKNNKIFLKRWVYPSVKFSDLFIGAQITVYSRLLKIIDYGDVFTRKTF